MILPQSLFAVVLLLIAGAVLLGSWPNTLKLTGKWRFELYYFDFAIGFALAAALAGFTFGNMGFDGFSLMDDLFHAGKRQWLFAFLAGGLFNLGNMLMTAGISVAGMSVAMPVGMGLRLILAVLLAQSARKSGSGSLVLLGCVLLLAAVVADALAYIWLQAARRDAILQEIKNTRMKGVYLPSPIKGLVLSIAGGMIAASILPLVSRASAGDFGMGPYTLIVLMAVGTFFSTIVFNLFFMNLPVEGEPLEIADYLKSNPKLHLFGLIGGMMCCAGLLAVYVVSNTPPELHIDRGTLAPIGESGPVLAGLWGLLVWREFKNGPGFSKLMSFVTLLLWAGGLALFSMATSAPKP